MDSPVTLNRTVFGIGGYNSLPYAGISFLEIVASDGLLNVLHYKTVGQVPLLKKKAVWKERRRKDMILCLRTSNISCRVPLKIFEELLFLLVIFCLAFLHSSILLQLSSALFDGY